MEETSTSESASPDVRPVICESLLDLSDWGDLLVSGDEGGRGASREASSAREPAMRDTQHGAFPQYGDSNLPQESSREQSIVHSVFKLNGSAARSRRKSHPPWPDVSVKLGQDVTYNCFPQEHFSFAFKDVPFEKRKKRQAASEDDEEDDWQVNSMVLSDTSKRDKSSTHKHTEKSSKSSEKNSKSAEKIPKSSDKTSKSLHSKKAERKTMVLVEVAGKNTQVSQSRNIDSKTVKTPGVKQCPRVVECAAPVLKKPAGLQGENLVKVATIISAGATTAQQRLEGAVKETQSACGVQEMMPSVVHEGASGPQEERRTPVQLNIGRVLPPTPPSEPVVAAPMAQVVPTQHPHPHCPQIVLRPPNQNIQIAYFSPTSQIVNPLSSQILTPPHMTVERPVASVSPLRKPEAVSSSACPKKPVIDATGTATEKVSVITACASGDAPVPGGKALDSQNNNDVSEKACETDMTTEKGGGDPEEVVIVDNEEEKSPVEGVMEGYQIEPSTDSRDDVQEALDVVRKKPPSSPCSSLLKIKCEKIDAVVRINKSDDALYRAEGRAEKSTVQTRRDSGSAAAQGCFFNMVEKSKRLGVCPCGRENAYDAMIACDNPHCEVEWYHFTCVGVTKVPKDDWFCPFCTKEAAKVLRKKEEQWKEKRRKKEEEKMKRRRKDVKEEEGLCPCGQPNSWDRMIACDGKECSVEWYHFKCVDVKSAPDEEWLCILCRDQDKEPKSSPYVRRRRSYKPIKFSIYGDHPDTESDVEDRPKSRDGEWVETGSSEPSEGSNTESSASSTDHDNEVECTRSRRSSGQKKRSKKRERTVWSDGDSDEALSDNDGLSSSRRSRRSRHMKIDLDFEDGSQFDDDFEEDRVSWKPRHVARKRRRIVCANDDGDGDDGDSMDKRSDTRSTKDKNVPKHNSPDARDAGTQPSDGLAKGDSNSAPGGFLIHECGSCGHEFIMPPSEGDSEPSTCLCPLCMGKASQVDPSKSSETASARASAGTSENAAESTLAKPASDLASSGLDSEDPGRRDGEGHGFRSKRVHEVVSCKVCGMGYRTRVSLLIHMKAKHQGHLGLFECTPCDKLFISREECAQHRASCHHS